MQVTSESIQIADKNGEMLMTMPLELVIGIAERVGYFTPYLHGDKFDYPYRMVRYYVMN
jgi:hypothetical protein